MADHRTEAAARNNAEWCNAVCTAHGQPGEFADGMWLNRQAAPPGYPSAVTLADARGAAAQLEQIDALIRAEIPGEWGIKDSFSALELGKRGFRVLFEAQWIYRCPSIAKPDDDLANVHWERIRSPARLAEWEDAWRGEPASGERSRPPAIFRSPLLEDERVAMLAACRDGRIVAGVIANRTGDVVGMSNLFAPASEFAAGCLAAVIDTFPGLAIVGYESGPALAAAQKMGFETIGPLRVWVRANSTRA